MLYRVTCVERGWCHGAAHYRTVAAHDPEHALRLGAGQLLPLRDAETWRSNCVRWKSDDQHGGWQVFLPGEAYCDAELYFEIDELGVAPAGR